MRRWLIEGGNVSLGGGVSRSPIISSGHHGPLTPPISQYQGTSRLLLNVFSLWAIAHPGR